MGSDKRKNEDEAEPSPFEGLQKNAVLHEARVFNQPQIDPRKCVRVMTKLLYLMAQGDELAPKEATNVFFSVTKLFQSQEPHLRRMIYLLVKELNVPPDESLIVIAPLSNDMNCKTELFRANAIRVLAKIIDPTMVAQIDRFLKQAVVEKNAFISSSALVAGMRLYRNGAEIVKRWVNEVQEALQSDNKMVQYHALGLLYKIRQHDRLAISKIVTSLCRAQPKGALAQCLLVRYICSVIAQQGDNPDRELFKTLTEFLLNKTFMVAYEAARCICKLPNATPTAISPAINVLQEFLSSMVPAQRFAAVRTLSEVVGRFPALVSVCCVDLEHLINDSNRGIATLAITTLLKTGAENNVDRLMKSISGFMGDIADEFKIVLVDALKTLCLKLPHKHTVIMGFISSALREEGGPDYKKALVYALLDIINHIPEAKEEGLEHFCEFIEDCEFADLAVKILRLLADEGPKTANPSKFIRYIFNRVILESAPVRAAAVSALASFGATVPSLTNSVIVLLRRVLNDNDDEVRDRAVYYLSVLEKHDQRTAEATLSPSLGLPLKDLELSLQVYLEKPHRTPFDIKKHKVEAVEDKKEDQEAGAAVASPLIAKPVSATAANPYLELLNSIPEFASLGPLFKSCKPVELTEAEAEYSLTCVKHIYAKHIVFQFNVTNNMEDQQLENVTVEMEPSDDRWAEELLVPEPKLAYGVPGTTFVVLARPDDAYVSGNIGCELKMEVKDVDSSSGEVANDATEDSYQLDGVEVAERDFVKMSEPLGLVEFKSQWESIGESHEVVKKYSLGLESLQAAVDAVMDLLGMQACENSGTVPEDKRSHAANLYGTFLGGHPVLCRAGFMMDAKLGVTLKIAVRCQLPDVATMLAGCIR